MKIVKLFSLVVLFSFALPNEGASNKKVTNSEFPLFFSSLPNKWQLVSAA